uniref:CoA transferase n=1 Tax=Globodera pallida TaxID=36090 RepID=A0A183BL14_GLOPA
MVQRFLEGVKVAELAGLAPVPFCGMILADFGAEVELLINKSTKNPLTNYGQGMGQKKWPIQLDFESEKDRRKLHNICCAADVLLDPFRPGTLEAIGLDPAALGKANPGLIVARITGYGQSGPMSNKAGHDINFVAFSGLLPTIFGNSRASPPWPPANLLADFAAGGLLAAFGRQQWLWHEEYALFSGKCPIYRTYETSDGKWMAVGAVEPKFQQRLFKRHKSFNETAFIFDQLLELGIEPQLFDSPEELTRQMERIFSMKTREHWTAIFSGEDACVTPVLNMDEVGHFEQHRERKAFGRMDEAEEGQTVWVPRAVPRRIGTEIDALHKAKL